MPCWHGEQRSCPCSHSICGGLGREWGPFSWGPFSETADSTPFVIITDIYLLKETNSDTSLYLLSVLPCSSALLLQSCAVFILFAKAFYFWPNQHRVVVVVEIRLFFFFFLRVHSLHINKILINTGMKFDRKGTLNFVFISPRKYIVYGVFVSPLLCHYPKKSPWTWKKLSLCNFHEKKAFPQRKEVHRAYMRGMSCSATFRPLFSLT